ncbi:MAG: hypothetical protein GXP27_01860, partial [Planctomycetes bacterium]|nr:hypothetical protein [Planctomycetota bacterium]
MPPFDTFTYNFARDRAELYEDLRRHKVNWVSMSEPQWRLDGGKLILDFTYLDQEITLSKGKGPHLAVYGFIKNMADRLQNEYEIPWDDPRAKEYIIEYARRWAAHLEELGMSPDQYAWQIYDEPRNKTDFARLREIVPLLKEAVPQVRFALDPLTKDPELYRDMGPYIDLWIPHHGMVYTADPERDPTTVGQRMPDASTAATMDVLLKNRKEGSRMWCYMQYAHQEQAYRECPAAVFRHYVWRIIWGLKADGVAFHAHWYASGQLKRPCKGWEAFREGIEDVQWALLLQEAVEEGRVDKELGHRALRAV